ncbi:MAG TPA: hypothetical protein VFQ53_16210 [Kofleriaceae bacterium]|nr:hypothetical protein [Kofleriaceae bacterium]
MKRYVGLVDIGIAVIVLVAVAMPPREMYATAAVKGTDAERFELALAEARTMAKPDDGARVDELTHDLGQVGFRDWAVEAGRHGIERTKQSPSHWRALLATSVAYIDRLEVKDALDLANKALAACDAVGTDACPSWERVRMEAYQKHLQAGVDKGIDPKRNPKAFREAGESVIRTIHIGGRHDREQQPPAPPPAPGSQQPPANP